MIDTFPDLLRASMGLRQVTQADIARALEIDASQVHRYLHNKATPSVKQLVIIAQVLGWDDATRVRATNLIAREW